jgi:hypothetical protein
MSKRPSKSRAHKPVIIRNMSAEAVAAAKLFKDLRLSRTPAKLKSPRSDAIRRAVRTYYLG